MRTAIIYDFDGTLARGYMQNETLIPEVLGIAEPKDFWDRVKRDKEAADADEVLTYLHLLLKLAEERGQPLTRSLLKKHGSKPRLFEGLADESWFDRMNDLGRRYGLEVEHYIISSGILDMIDGSPIANRFRRIFASSYHFDDTGKAIAAGVAINYTTKTQYLFRINKGIENSWNDKALNAFMKPTRRPIPFERMIFLGDGDTDIPTMKMMHAQGGYSVGVYDPSSTADELKRVHRLISDERVNFVAAGDYRDGTALDIIVKGILGRIALANSELTDLPEAP